VSLTNCGPNSAAIAEQDAALLDMLNAGLFWRPTNQSTHWLGANAISVGGADKHLVMVKSRTRQWAKRRGITRRQAFSASILAGLTNLSPAQKRARLRSAAAQSRHRHWCRWARGGAPSG
jgi:hypothetical protein